MGLLGDIGDFLQGAATEIGSAVGTVIGGPGVGTAIGGSLGALIEGGGGGGRPRTPGVSGLPARTGGGGSGFNFSGPSFGGSVDLPGLPRIGGSVTGPRFQITSGNGQSQNQGGQQMVPQGGFQQALMMELVEKSVRSKSGRSILEAMTSGSLQQGVIQPVQSVQTPRGPRNFSPPGFRTVYVNDQPYAVFKPLAKALNLLPKTSTCKVSSADMKAINKADRLTKKLKRLAKKTGNLKVTNK